MQNLSNQNLEDLLDFDPPKNYVTRVNNNTQDSHDQSQLSNGSTIMPSNNLESNNRSQLVGDNSNSFRQKVFKTSQLRSPKKKRKHTSALENHLSSTCSGSNFLTMLSFMGNSSGTGFNNASNGGAENNNENSGNGGYGPGGNNNEDSFGNNSYLKGQNLRLSSSFQEIFQIQKIFRESHN